MKRGDSGEGEPSQVEGSGLGWFKIPRHVGGQVKNRNPILAKVYRKKMVY